MVTCVSTGMGSLDIRHPGCTLGRYHLGPADPLAAEDGLVWALARSQCDRAHSEVSGDMSHWMRILKRYAGMPFQTTEWL